MSGRGQHQATANAIEELLAAELRGDAAAASRQVSTLRTLRARTLCGVSPRRIQADIQALVARLALSVRTASRVPPVPPGDLGDVRADLTNGRTVWFEVKAQTFKWGFDEVVQGDWVRDETSFLARVYANDASFRRHMVGRPGAATLGSFVSTGVLGLSEEDLWLADVALLRTPAHLSAAGVQTRADLGRWMQDKYMVQLTQSGIRCIRLADLPIVIAVLNGAPIVRRTAVLRRSVANYITVPSCLAKTVFTYYCGYRRLGVVGRHKANAPAFHGAVPIFQR